MINVNSLTDTVREIALKPDVRNYINVGFSLIMVIILSIFALRPAIITVISLNEKLTLARQRSAQLAEKVNQLSQAQRNYEIARPDLNVILGAVPQNPDLTQFITQINSIASFSQVKVVSFVTRDVPFLATDSAGVVSKTEITLKATGNFDNLQSFFKDLDNLPRLVEVQRVTFKNESEEAESTDFSATASLTTYNTK